MSLRDNAVRLAGTREMQYPLVIGYGSTLRSDDGFGPAVVEALQAREDLPKVRLLSRQLLTIDLLDHLEQASLCVLLDAATTGDAGALIEREVTPNSDELDVLGHDLSPAALLALAHKIHGRAPRCVLLTTRLINSELGEALSSEVASVVPNAVERVMGILRESGRSSFIVG